ncbi:MAG: NADPH-dependent reductase, partial [Parcubacteria group bacterium]|nr:NADPH-dependent reductase [Parcubacteria group bacterium]
MNILTISGSMRAGSFNTMLVKALPALAPDHTFTQLDYAGLPLFSQDLENPFPESVTALKDQIKAADVVIISTPEYNRTIPAAL